MIYKYIYFFIFFLFSHSSFACIIAQEKDYAALDVAIVSGNYALRQSLVSQFCFNHKQFYQQMALEGKDYQGILKARHVEDLNIVFKNSDSIRIFENGHFNRDLLSFYLLPYHMPHIDKDNQIHAQSYLNNTIDLHFTPLDDTTHTDILNYLVMRYKKESYIFSDVQSHMNNFHFSIITNNPSILQQLMSFNNAKDFIYQKNAYGFTPFHYLFIKPLTYHSSLKKQQQIIMNTLIVSSLTEEELLKHNYNGYNFLYFCEIMKEKNLPLYYLIKKKFPSHIIINHRLSLQRNIYKQLNNSIEPILNSYKDED